MNLLRGTSTAVKPDAKTQPADSTAGASLRSPGYGSEPLKAQADCELYHPFIDSVTALGLDGRYLRIAAKRPDGPVRIQHHVRYVRSRIAEVRRVGGIECLRAKFQVAFPNGESPVNTKIQVK